jgi:hypothetical protein
VRHGVTGLLVALIFTAMALSPLLARMASRREDATRHASRSCAGLTDRHGVHDPPSECPILITTVCWPPLSSPRKPMNSL